MHCYLTGKKLNFKSNDFHFKTDFFIQIEKAVENWSLHMLLLGEKDKFKKKINTYWAYSVKILMMNKEKKLHTIWPMVFILSL